MLKQWLETIGISLVITIPVVWGIFCLVTFITGHTPLAVNFIHEEKPKDQQPFFCAFFEKENELKCMPYEDFLEMLKERNKEDAIKL